MTYKENITAILECYFSGFKKEIIDSACNRILEQEPQTFKGYCKDCKYFEYDHFENMGGIPLITVHEVCTRRGLVCKTDEDGYCHLWEHKAESEES